MTVLLTMAALALPGHVPVASAHVDVVWHGVRRERAAARWLRATRVYHATQQRLRVAAEATLTAAAAAPSTATPPTTAAGGRSAAAPSADVWAALADCESSGDWSYNGSSGFDGGLQFAPGTWSAYAPKAGVAAAYAYLASPGEQVAVAQLVLAAQGWAAWPACAAKLGLG